jgi:hypothetical protein
MQNLANADGESERLIARIGRVELLFVCVCVSVNVKYYLDQVR